MGTTKLFRLFGAILIVLFLCNTFQLLDRIEMKKRYQEELKADRFYRFVDGYKTATLVSQSALNVSKDLSKRDKDSIWGFTKYQASVIGIELK